MGRLCRSARLPCAGVTPLQLKAIACREKNIAGGKEQFERDNYCRR